MVSGTTEQQFRARAHRALEADKSFSARGPVNKAILEEVRAEVAAGKEHIRASAASGVKRIKSTLLVESNTLQRRKMPPCRR